MIFDRTLSDISKAKSIYASKVKKFVELTETDIIALERGTFSLETINRIEAKQTEIVRMLNETGYYGVSDVQNKIWGSSDVFKQTDLERLCKNTATLRNAFIEISDMPENPLPRYYFEEINNLERILYLLEMYIDVLRQKYRICGTFVCGEV